LYDERSTDSFGQSKVGMQRRTILTTFTRRPAWQQGLIGAALAVEKQIETLWQQDEAKLAASVPGGVVDVVSSGHDIQTLNPDAVITALKSVLPAVHASQSAIAFPIDHHDGWLVGVPPDTCRSWRPALAIEIGSPAR
jgi:hypothetical protein